MPIVHISEVLSNVYRKLAQEREKPCRMDLTDPGILTQSQRVDKLIIQVMREGGEKRGQEAQ